MDINWNTDAKKESSAKKKKNCLTDMQIYDQILFLFHFLIIFSFSLSK